MTGGEGDEGVVALINGAGLLCKSSLLKGDCMRDFSSVSVASSITGVITSLFSSFLMSSITLGSSSSEVPDSFVSSSSGEPCAWD